MRAMHFQVGDAVGVFVTMEGDLHFMFNGIDQGVAWSHLPTDKPLYVAINFYWKSTQISVHPSTLSK